MQSAVRLPVLPTTHSVGTRRELSSFAAAFATAAPPGWLLAAKFESPRMLLAGPSRWTVWMSIHFVENEASATRRIMASVYFTTKALEESANEYLQKMNWYDAVTRQLKRMGYHGHWSTRGNHPCGDFWKYGLGTAMNALQEMRRLHEMRFPRLMANKRRRATTRPRR